MGRLTKEEVTLQYLAGDKQLDDLMKEGTRVEKSDEMRELFCSLSPQHALYYAYWVDQEAREDTRKAARRDPFHYFLYMYLMDN